MMTILQSVARYETWLRAQLGPDIVEKDLEEKHKKMRESPFVFLRATYWRWAETILDICKGLENAPEVLAIGDTHLENFGTWRDAEGRLVWGVNDFDDAAAMPYALDLVRLAASALLSRRNGEPSSRDIAGWILAGYRKGLDAPSPVVLDRDHEELRNQLVLPDKERNKFWKKYWEMAPAEKLIPPRYIEALRNDLPDRNMPFETKPRTAGTGSLGRPRFVAVAEWRGGPLLREAKALVQSAWLLKHDPGDVTIYVGMVASGRNRSPDPHYNVDDGILVRRLSPNSRKIEVEDEASLLLSGHMLWLMGFEIANCHASDPGRVDAIVKDMDERSGDWLRDAAKVAASFIAKEQREYAAA